MIYLESPSSSLPDDDDRDSAGAGTITTCFPLALIMHFESELDYLVQD